MNLVEVLRGKPRWATTDEQEQAADEIERMTAELYRKDQRVKAWKKSSDEHEADNERLRAALEFIAAADQIHLWDAIKAADEALAAVEDKT